MPRSELFITSKLWNSQHHPDLVEAALDDTLQELGLECVGILRCSAAATDLAVDVQLP